MNIAVHWRVLRVPRVKKQRQCMSRTASRLLNLWHSGDQLPVLSDLIDKFGFIAEFGGASIAQFIGIDGLRLFLGGAEKAEDPNLLLPVIVTQRDCDQHD